MLQDEPDEFPAHLQESGTVIFPTVQVWNRPHGGIQLRTAPPLPRARMLLPTFEPLLILSGLL